MRKFKLLIALAIVLTVGAMHSCSKDAIPSKDALASSQGFDKNKGEEDAEENCDRDIQSLNGRELFTELFARFLATQLADPGFKNYLLDEMYFSYGTEIERVSNEFFIAEHLNDVVSLSNGTTTTLHGLFDQYTQDLGNFQNLLSQICSEYYSTVLDFPWYGEDVINSHTKNNVPIKLGAFAQSDLITCNGQTGNIMYTEDASQVMVLGGSASVGYIPIIVKEAEEHVLFEDPNDIKSFAGTNFQELLENSIGYKADCDVSTVDFMQFVKTLTCSSSSTFDLFKLHKFIKEHCSTSRSTEDNCSDCLDNDGDGLIDCADPDCECEPKEICDNGMDDDCDGLIDQNDPDCPCNQNCSRDCVQDNTILKALAFSKPSMLYYVLVPGEGLIELNYNFASVSICDPFNTIDCGPTAGGSVEKTFTGLTSQFFFPQGPWQWFEEWPDGPMPQIDVDGVFYMEVEGAAGERVFTYWKAWPVVVDIEWLVMGEWNGNAIGNQIVYRVVEYDGFSTNLNYSVTVSSTASDQSQSSSNSGNNNNGTNSQSSSYTFNTGVTNSSTVQQSIRYEKDYPVGQYRIFYCEGNQNIPDPFGYTDGWFGFIPDRSGNLDFESLIDLFEIR